MESMKKALLGVGSVALVAALSVAGTIAYLTSQDEDVNVMTLGNVKIEQIEQQWNDDKSDLELLKTAFHGKIQESLDEKHFDYIYLRENLDKLSGSKYQKKRNHISRFLRSFPQADFQPLSKENLEEAWKVEELWFEAAKSQSELSDSESLEQEYLIIKEALENFEKLNLSGGIVYIEKNPVAMTVASKINSRIMDIHFEKALMPFAFEGAYSFINNQFAKTKDFELFNREEDLGLEGLKKAKLSYYPEQILKKWFVKIEL
jgi:predicted ribosomally synthesized peptide with SipW-like signal peptide